MSVSAAFTQCILRLCFSLSYWTFQRCLFLDISLQRAVKRRFLSLLECCSLFLNNHLLPLLLIILVESNSSSEQRLTEGHNFCNEREALQKDSVLVPENYSARKHKYWFILLKMTKVISIARILNSTLFSEKFSEFLVLSSRGETTGK